MHSNGKKKSLVILGAGGFAREVLSWIDHKGDTVFFTEDPNGNHSIKGNPVALTLEHLKGHKFLAAVGDPKARQKLWDMAEAAGLYCDGVLYANGVILGDDIRFGPGVLMCPGVVVSPDVTLGKSVLLNLNVTVGHDCELGDFVTVSPGAHISGNVRIGEGAYIGTGAVIREGVTIGAGAVVGMGSVILKDVPPNEVWAGVPAKLIRMIHV